MDAGCPAPGRATGEERRHPHPASHVLLAPRDAGRGGKGDQELAGHSTLAMTQRYMHLSPAAKDSAIALLNARPVDSLDVRGTSLAPSGVPQANPNDFG